MPLAAAHWRRLVNSATNRRAVQERSLEQAGQRQPELAPQAMLARVARPTRSPGPSAKADDSGLYYKTNIYSDAMMSAGGLTCWDASAQLAYLHILASQISDPKTTVHECGHAITMSEHNWIDQKNTGFWWEAVAGSELQGRADRRDTRELGPLREKGSWTVDLELSDKVAVVTGASKGIGLAITRMLVAEGAHVVAGARNVGELAGLERVAPLAVDLASPEGPASLVRHALERHGRVDVLVNNVGAVRLRTQGFLGTSDEEFEWSLRTNFLSAVRASRAVLPPMLERGGGAIVNVASVNAFFEPDSGVIDYGAAKAALLTFAKALSQEFGPRGIRVNSVSPGPVSTDLWMGKGGVVDTVSKATGLDPDAARKQVVSSIGGFATGRFTTPEEVATLVVMLASSRTGNVTGSNFVIDGGLLKTL